MSAIYRVLVSTFLIISFFPAYCGQQQFQRWKREEFEINIKKPGCDLGHATTQLIAIALSERCLRSTINGIAQDLQKLLNASQAYDYEKTIVEGLLQSSARLKFEQVMSLEQNFFYGEKKPHGTIMHYAAYTGNLSLIKCIMNVRAEDARKVVDAQGNSPLHLAVMGGRPEAVELLMRSGFDANAANKSKQLPIDLVSGQCKTHDRIKTLLCSTLVCQKEERRIPRSTSFTLLPQKASAQRPILCSSTHKKGNSSSSCLIGFLKCMSIQVD